MKPADADERAGALDLGRHVIAVAPAGSGKTGLLVQRFLAALATVDAPEQVVAITFTNKAAAEIRSRVGTLLRRAAAGEPARNDHDERSLELARAVVERDRRLGWELAGDPGRLQTSTIDGFNGRIARELPLLSGLGGRPDVTDDPRGLYERALLALFDSALADAADPTLAEAAAAWLRSAGNRIDRLLPPLVDLLSRRDQWAEAVLDDGWNDDAVLEALHRDHQRAFHDALGPDAQRLVDIAREGSGYDDTLAWAAGLAGWPESGSTQAEIHRALARLLVKSEGLLRGPNGISRAQGFPPGSPAKPRLQALIRDRENDGRLEAAAAALQRLPPARFPDTLLALRGHLRLLLRHALAQLRLAMAARGETDFGEIALAALQALRPDGGFGDALLARDRRIRHLLVDEMQDTSEAQVRLLEELTQGWQPDDGHSLFLVGDPQQSIYAFRNARVALFMALWSTRRLGELALHPVRLSVNFRSTPALIAWFNDSFTTCFPPRDDLYSGEIAYTPAAPVGQQDSDANGGGAVHAFSDPADEAEAAADRAARLAVAGECSIAILARARTHLPAVLAGLRARGVRYACQDIDALRALPAVRDLLACARALWHPQDRLHWAILLRTPWVGLSWADLVALSAGRRDQAWPQRLRETPPQALSEDGRRRVARLLAALAAVTADRECPPLADRVERLWRRLGGPACGGPGELADARRTLQLLRKHAGACGFEDLPAFERAVGELYASPEDGAVQVMTIHKAKGLEFDHVMLVGCGRKSRGEDRPLLHLVETPHGALLVPKPPEHWPVPDGTGATALYDYAHAWHKVTRHSEFLRLLYVAATRARRSLHLYASLKPRKDGSFAPPANTFAAALWQRHFRGAFECIEAAGTAAAGRRAEPPRAPRLPADFVIPEDEALFVPRERRTLRPSESVLSALQIKRDDEREDNVHARLVGTLYHQAMQRIAETGTAAWHQEAGRHPRSLAAGFRRLGLPEPQVDAAVARVLELVGRTLHSRHGQWLLAPKPWAEVEYALSGYLDGEWVAAAIDRCFEDDDGARWIVDYKTTAEALPAIGIAGYVERCREEYAPQLRLYARLLALDRPGRPVRTALYLAEPDHLIEFDAV